MAMASEDMDVLLDSITCAVCLQVITDPQALACLHSYCNNCVKKLENRGLICCPECREFTRIKDIKSDFKTQRIIDIYYRLANQGTSYTTIESLARSKSPVHLQFKGAITQLSLEKSHIDQCMRKIEVAIGDVRKSEVRQFETVDRHTDDIIREITNNKDRLKQVIRQTNSTVVNQLHTNKQLYEDSLNYIQDKIDYFKNIRQTEDQSSLEILAAGLENQVREDMMSLRAKQVDPEPWNIRSPVTVEKGTRWDVRDIIQVNFNTSDLHVIGSASHTDTTHSSDNTISQSVIKMDLDYHPHRLYMIDHTLWCVALNAIHAYTTEDCSHVNTMTNQHLRFARGLTQTNTKDIIVACSNKKGLLHLDNACQYKSHIIEGVSFSDVYYGNDHLYALDCDQGRVVIFGSHETSWVQIHEFKPHYSNPHKHDRLAIHDSEIYISSSNNNCLYIYSVDGAFIKQAGVTGSLNTPGQLSGVLLCNIDSDGNVLVADYSNHRLQVYGKNNGPEGQWCIIILPHSGVICSPVDALTDEMADNTWVITNNPQQLLKITSHD